MSDSCNPRKLDPGLAARYSKPNDLITSTIKSDPGRSVVRTSTPDASVSASTGGAAGATKGWAPMAPVVATRLATPLTAAPFKNARRSTAFLDLSMAFGASRYGYTYAVMQYVSAAVNALFQPENNWTSRAVVAILFLDDKLVVAGFLWDVFMYPSAILIPPT